MANPVPVFAFSLFLEPPLSVLHQKRHHFQLQSSQSAFKGASLKFRSSFPKSWEKHGSRMSSSSRTILHMGEEVFLYSKPDNWWELQLYLRKLLKGLCGTSFTACRCINDKFHVLHFLHKRGWLEVFQSPRCRTVFLPQGNIKLGVGRRMWSVLLTRINVGITCSSNSWYFLLKA